MKKPLNIAQSPLAGTDGAKNDGGMKIRCEEVVEKTLSELCTSFQYMPYDRGLCIVTPYLYPDNDLIEVFIEELAGGLLRVTDLGETLRHLASRGIDVLNSPKRRFMLEQIARRLHVVLTGGRLEKEVLLKR